MCMFAGNFDSIFFLEVTPPLNLLEQFVIATPLNCSTFQTKCFLKCSYLLKNTLLNLIFGKNLNNRKNLQDLRGQDHCKNVGPVKHFAIYHDFHGLKLSYLYLI